jgi:hypothetical protein
MITVPASKPPESGLAGAGAEVIESIETVVNTRNCDSPKVLLFARLTLLPEITAALDLDPFVLFTRDCRDSGESVATPPSRQE